MCDYEWMIAFFSTYCCVNSCIHLYSVRKLLSYLVNRVLASRGEPIVLKILMIMLCCTAHEMCHLCSWNCQISSKMCLTVPKWQCVSVKFLLLETILYSFTFNKRVFAVHANSRSAIGWWQWWTGLLDKSLDSVACSLPLDPLTETWVTWLVTVVLLLVHGSHLCPIKQCKANNHTHMSTSRSRCAWRHATTAAALILCPHCALCPI